MIITFSAFKQLSKAFGLQLLAFMTLAETALAQGMMNGGSCSMCGVGMIFGWIFMIAVSVGVVAFVVSLIRRGRHSKLGTRT